MSRESRSETAGSDVGRRAGRYEKMKVGARGARASAHVVAKLCWTTRRGGHGVAARTNRHRLMASVVASMILGFVAFVGEASAGLSPAMTFDSTGGEQSYVVPAGVTTVRVEAVGGRARTATRLTACPEEQVASARTSSPTSR